MTCSRCHQPGHNSRNRGCPARISPNNTWLENTRLRNPIRYKVNAIVLRFVREIYHDLIPYSTIRVINSIHYACYKLPRGIFTNPHAIVHQFIHPVTRHVVPLEVPGFAPHIIGLCIVVNSKLKLLHDQEYPTGKDIFLSVPLIPGINKPTFLAPRVVSNFVKEWDITLDLTCNTCETETECAICFDVKSLTLVAKTNCDHEYCIGCVKNFIQSNKDKTSKLTCPLCRTELRELLVVNPEEHSSLCNYIVAL